jgi:hypothetical protein
VSGAIEKCIVLSSAKFEDRVAARAELAALRKENEELKGKNELLCRAVEAAAAENARMREALEKDLPELQQYMEDVGGCDHSVGICCCPLEDAIRVTKESLSGTAPSTHRLGPVERLREIATRADVLVADWNGDAGDMGRATSLRDAIAALLREEKT